MSNNNNFNKGIFLTAAGSFWWGLIGVIYFKYIAFAGHIEVVIHRSLWTTVMLIFTTLLFSRFSKLKKLIKIKKNILILFFSGILIFTNWAVWIYAVSSDRLIDASFGYFIMPIISIFLGYFFFKEYLSFKGKISVVIVFFSILFLIVSNFNSIPWVGLIVAFSWSFYNLLRKKIEVETDIGLLIESLFILPVILIAFYFIVQNNFNDFSLSNPKLMLIFMLAGPMTVIPLYLYVRGVELCGLGPTGMIFYITPTLQFLLGFFIYNEALNLEKLISFIFIWIAVFIYLKDIYENK
ncbi:EamA family transporter RarD [Candidatus Pelagibacter sp.]|nr:EamA family transporter RarD [Candidatus Pelagibacter sp.]